MKIYYRPHRGSLSDAMKEKKEFSSMTDLILDIKKQFKEHIEISYYCYDDRLPAETFIVTISKDKKDCAIGFVWFGG